jgi:hypothetical protein
MHTAKNSINLLETSDATHKPAGLEKKEAPLDFIHDSGGIGNLVNMIHSSPLQTAQAKSIDRLFAANPEVSNSVQSHNDNSIANPLQLKSSNSQTQPVAQMYPEWLDNLFQMAIDNPLAAGGTFAAGVFALLAFWYWNNPNPPPVEHPPPHEEEEPDRTTVAGVAAALHMDEETLLNQLENGEGNVDMVDVGHVFSAADGVIGGLIPPTILADLPEDNQQIVDTIFDRINHWPFNYNGIYQSGYQGFLSRNGDCNTLAQMMVLACQAAGVDNVEIEDDFEAMLVVQHAIHGRDTTSNVDGQAYWFFHDHHWCEYNGARYDLLFMGNATPQAFHRTNEDQQYHGINYDVFEGGRAMIHAEQFGGLDTDLGEGRLGYVANSVEDIQEYIDEHRQG